MNARIAPLTAPYPENVRKDLAAIMPPGMEPLILFRTLAKNPRVLQRIRRGGLLDQGSIGLRQRELVILRTTALCRAEYEWGVHVAFFGGAAGFSAEQRYATVWLDAHAPCWSREESAIITLCDELHERAQLSDSAFAALREHFTETQLLELLVLGGFYRTISYVVNGCRLALEPAVTRFPAELERPQSIEHR